MSIANFSVESRWKPGGEWGCGVEPGISASMKAFLSYVNEERGGGGGGVGKKKQKDVEEQEKKGRAGRQAGKWEGR